MALLGEDDDFFGDDNDDNETPINYTDLDDEVNGSVAKDLTTGLAAAEIMAMEDRYRKLGFHDTYETSEEEMLQKGFEDGFAETFQVSKRIGAHIGALTFLHFQGRNAQDTESPSSRTPSRTEPSENASSSFPLLEAINKTQEYLSNRSNSAPGTLGEGAKDDLGGLESAVEQIVAKSTTNHG